MRSNSQPLLCRLALVLALACLTGCTAMSRSQQTFRWVDPVEPGIGSGTQGTAPLGAQPGRAQRPGPDPRRPADESGTIIETHPSIQKDPRQPGQPSQPNSSSHDDLETESAIRPELGAEERNSEEEHEPRTSGKLTVPSIEVEEIVADGELELEVRAPEQAVVGRLTTYHILLRNGTRDAALDLTVVCRLPVGVRFPGSDTDELAATTARLEQGETKEWDLSLIADVAGAKCCVFELRKSDFSVGDPPTVERSVCVEFSERQFTVDLLGPGKRVENGRAEFIINVGNPSESPRERVRVHVSFDRALKPHDVTERAVSSDENGLIWNLGTLESGAKQQLQLEFNCLSPARRACVRVEITADGMEPEREEACVEIVAQSGSIDLKLSDRIEPFYVGKRGVYDLQIKNIDLQPARNVIIEAKLPEELVVLSAKLRRGDEDLEIQYSVRNDRLVFDPVDRLAADEQIDGIIEVEGVAGGRVELRASVTSSLNPTPVTSAEPTIIEP